MTPEVFAGLESSQKINANFIINKVSEVTGIAYGDMQRKTRKRPIVEARQLAMWYMSDRLNMRLNAIGNQFNQHHATVIHGKRNIENLKNSCPFIKEFIANLDKLIL